MRPPRTASASPRRATPVFAPVLALVCLGALPACDHYGAARAALAAGDPRAAARLVRPRDVAGYRLRARARLAAGLPAAAADDLRAALARRPRRRVAAEINALLGRAELAARRHAPALAALRRAEDLEPGCCGVRPLLGELLRERAGELAALGQPRAARDDLEAAARLAPAAPGLPALRAVVAAAERRAGRAPASRPAGCAARNDPAAPECRDLERTAPEVFARLAVARGWPIARPATVTALLTRDGRAPGELDDLLDVRPLLPRVASLPLLTRAAVYRLAGREPEARAALDQALAEGGTDPAVRRRIATEALLWGDLAAADRHLRWADAFAGGPGGVCETRCTLLRLEGDWRGELERRLATARLAAQPAAALRAVGVRYRRRGELAPAAVAFAAAGDAARTDLEATVADLAAWWLRLDRPGAVAARDHAVAAWRALLGDAATEALVARVAAVAARPRVLVAARLAAGDLRGAGAALAAVPPAPEPACPGEAREGEEPLPLLRARLARAQGDEAAARRLVAAYADAPAARACRYPAAIRALEEAGDLAGALALARDLTEELPRDPQALLRRGRLELRTGAAAAAALDLEAYVFHRADRAAAFDEVAATYLAAGRSREACGALSRALAFRGGGDGPTLLALGQCLVRDRRPEEAAAVLRRYVEAAPPWARPRAVRRAARALAGAGALGLARSWTDPVTRAALGDGEAAGPAREILEAAARRRPHDPGLFVRRAEVQAAAGDEAGARALLQRARAIRPAAPVVLRAVARLASRLEGPGAEPVLLQLAAAGDRDVRCAAAAALQRLYRELGAAGLAAREREGRDGCPPGPPPPTAAPRRRPGR